jgi:dTDP-glucose pyrophosphorylase
MEQIWRRALLRSDATVEDAVRNLDQVAIKIVLIVDEGNRFIGTISDGDIRRALLRGLKFDSSIETLINRKALIVPNEMSRELVIQLMAANKIYQVPIINDRQELVGLHLWDEMLEQEERPNTVVIMAGGMGRRLMPHTKLVPKPMVMISGKPMLEHIINRCKAEGFTNFVISIHHLGHIIEEYFQFGERFGVNIEYIKESSPLGTAGSLSLLQPKPTSPFVVTNGDVITNLRYGELVDFHNRQSAMATMAIRVHEWQNPFGVVETSGIEITGFREKPIVVSHINAGIYVFSPEALSELKESECCDIPEFFERIRIRGGRTLAYPMHEPWHDIGRPEDLISVDTHFQIFNGD